MWFVKKLIIDTPKMFTVASVKRRYIVKKDNEPGCFKSKLKLNMLVMLKDRLSTLYMDITRESM